MFLCGCPFQSLAIFNRLYHVSTSRSEFTYPTIANAFPMMGLQRAKKGPSPPYSHYSWVQRVKKYPFKYIHTLGLLLCALNSSNFFNLSTKILFAPPFKNFIYHLWNLSKIPVLFLVLPPGVDKTPVLSPVTVLSLIHPEPYAVAKTTPHCWQSLSMKDRARQSHTPNTNDLEEKKWGQAGKQVSEPDSKDIPGNHSPEWKSGHRHVKFWFEACGKLTTQSNSSSSGCWLLNGNIQIREEMTAHSKQNCTHLGRLRK